MVVVFFYYKMIALMGGMTSKMQWFWRSWILNPSKAISPVFIFCMCFFKPLFLWPKKQTWHFHAKKPPEVWISTQRLPVFGRRWKARTVQRRPLSLPTPNSWRLGIYCETTLRAVPKEDIQRLMGIQKIWWEKYLQMLVKPWYIIGKN